MYTDKRTRTVGEHDGGKLAEVIPIEYGRVILKKKGMMSVIEMEAFREEQAAVRKRGKLRVVFVVLAGVFAALTVMGVLMATGILKTQAVNPDASAVIFYGILTVICLAAFWFTGRDKKC